ncbi:MAG: AAA family ATPase, partial [Planctomycetes bacterium]|nr:AAA family ATPase [Planctomycetota bacterium]
MPSTLQNEGITSSKFPDVLPWGKPLHPADYEILGELGRGGMGIVYLAQDHKHGRRVALKTMQWLDPSTLYRFKQEFRSLADLAHPNLVSLHDLVIQGTTCFFTMEFVEGVNFLAHVRPADASGPNSSSPACNVERLRPALRQLAEGLAVLHRAGKVHRDIKPSNVLVTPAGRVVVVDFGLATELHPLGQQRSTNQGLVGTIAYMAPEQAAGLPVGPAGDCYSVGVMLYQALTGRLPFIGDARQILEEKQTTEPGPPSEAVAGVPEDLDALCLQLLRRDPAARPSAEEVLSRLGSAPAEAGLIPSLHPEGTQGRPFVGRRQQLQALEEAFRATREGRTVAVYLQGRSGVGKSALAQCFLDQLVETEGVVILAGRCYEHESVPYKGLDGLVDSLSRYLRSLSTQEVDALLPRDVLQLARVFPVLRRVEAVARFPSRAAEIPEAQELRRRAFGALRELLARLGDRKPLVLFIDDLQWGDVDSAVLLSELLRPPDAPVLLLIGSCRMENAGSNPVLRALLNPEHRKEQSLDRRDLIIEPLDRTEAQELAQLLLESSRSPAQGKVEVIARESGGNPFFVYELVHYLQRGQGGAPGLSEEHLSLDRVLWARTRDLPEEARRLLEVLAVAGRPLLPEDAYQAAGLDADSGSLALAALRAAGLVRSVGSGNLGEVETFHDRIRETVLGHLSPAALQECHHRLARTLARWESTAPEVLAVHFLGAGDIDQAAEYYAAAAARAADLLAFDRAAKLYRLVLELRPPQDERAERRLRTQLGDALANAGRGTEAAPAYLAAANKAPAEEALELRRRAAWQLLISGHVDEGLAVVRTVLAAVGMTMPRTPRGALCSLLVSRLKLRLRGLDFREREVSQVAPEDLKRIDICWSVATGLTMIDPVRGSDYQTRGLLLALRTGEPFRIGRALTLEAGHLASEGTRAARRVQRLLLTAEELAQRHHHPYTLGMVSLMRGVAAYFQGTWQAALDHCDRGEAILRERCTGTTWEMDTLHTFALWSLHHMGAVVELSRRWRQYLQEAKDKGDLYAQAYLGTNIMSLVRLAGDQAAEARRDLDQVLAQWSQQ